MRSILLILLASSAASRAQEPPLTLDESFQKAPATEAPLPPAADFSADKEAFRDDVQTPVEDGFLEEIELGNRRIHQDQPLFRRYGGLAYATEAAAGLFGAGIVGLVGGSIGEAIDAGDPNIALGGASGQAFGLVGGAYVGSSMGVWGASLLFQKRLHPAWSFLGGALGTVVGGAGATGLLFALEDDPKTAGGLAVATLFLFQVGGAMLFTEVGLPEGPQ